MVDKKWHTTAEILDSTTRRSVKTGAQRMAFSSNKWNELSKSERWLSFVAAEKLANQIENNLHHSTHYPREYNECHFCSEIRKVVGVLRGADK